MKVNWKAIGEGIKTYGSLALGTAMVVLPHLDSIRTFVGDMRYCGGNKNVSYSDAVSAILHSGMYSNDKTYAAAALPKDADTELYRSVVAVVNSNIYILVTNWNLSIIFVNKRKPSASSFLFIRENYMVFNERKIYVYLWRKKIMTRQKTTRIIVNVIIMCIMGIICAGMIYINNLKHEEKLSETISTYEQEISVLEYQYEDMVYDYNELIERMNELEEGVYDMMEGEEYEFTLYLGSDGTHTYRGEKNGWFMNESHITTGY